MDDIFDCTDRTDEGRINIDPIYNGTIVYDDANPEIEFGRPVSNPAVFTFLTNIHSARKNAREPIPIPERLTKTLGHVKKSLLVDPISYHEDGRMIGADEFTSKWVSKQPRKVNVGREIEKIIPDRKGRRYKRTFFKQAEPNVPSISVSISHDMEPFEAAQFVNLFPESAEETKALIPTLSRLKDHECHYYRDELNRFEWNNKPEAQSGMVESASKRFRHVAFKHRTVSRAMLELHRAQKTNPAVLGHVPTTPNLDVPQTPQRGTPGGGYHSYGGTVGGGHVPMTPGMGRQNPHSPGQGVLAQARTPSGPMPNSRTPRRDDYRTGMQQAPNSPGGIQVTPRSPGGIQVTPRSPGGIQATPRSPGGIQVTPRSPGGIQVTPRSPGGIQVTPRSPGGIQVTPRSPGGIQVTPRSPGGIQETPRSPGMLHVQPNVKTPSGPAPAHMQTSQTPRSPG